MLRFFWGLECIILSLHALAIDESFSSVIVRYEETATTTEGNLNDYNTTERNATGHILDYVNLTTDPCTNFYEFACGKWIRNHPVPPSQSYLNQFYVVENRLQLQLKQILERDNVTDPVPVRAANLFYRSCMNKEKIESGSMAQLIQILTEYGGWPMTINNWKEENFNWIKMASDLARRWSLMPLIYIYVGVDKLNTTKRVIQIDQPTSILPQSMLINHEFYGIQLEAYKQWIAASALSVTKFTGQNVSPDDMEKQAGDVLAFEIKLAKLKSTLEMQRNPFRSYNRMTIRNLQEWTDSAVHSRKSIDWLYFVQNVFFETNIPIDYRENVIVKEVDMLFHLSKLLEETPSAIIANYLHWRLVVTMSRDITDEMRNYVTQFEQVFSGIAVNQPRWKDCIGSTSSLFSFAVGYKYVNEYFDENAKTEAETMVENILTVFKAEVNNSKWMDEKTRSSAVNKIAAMNRFIGYPEWFHNESALTYFYDGVIIGSNHFENIEFMRKYLFRKTLLTLRTETNRKEWVTGPAIVNAFNNIYLNSIILPAGILQLPFFDAKRNKALNYGSIGAIIGHEILHGFDDIGRLADENGNLVQWWTDDALSTYKNRSRCYIDQYSKFLIPLLNNTDKSGTNISVNGLITEGENIADNNGLRQAYLAYKKYIAERGSSEDPMPGLEQFTSEQLFFISYGLTWCESSTKENQLRDALTDTHSPHNVRVIGTLSNSAEFSSAFKCVPGSSMNPQLKCSIW